MPYLNDTGTLAEAISPAYVAAQAGQQNQIEQAKSGLANAVAMGQAPADVQKPYLANLFQQAQTSQENALAQKTGLENTLTQATQPGQIQATNAGNQLKVTQDQVQKLQTLGGYATQLAGVMDQVAPPARAGKMQEILQQQGIDTSQLPPEILSGDPDVLRHVAQSITQLSPTFQTEQMKATTEAGSREAVAQTEATGHVVAAQASAEARKFAATTNLQAKQLSQNVDQTIAMLGRKIAAAGTNADPNDLELMKVLQQQQILARQMGATTTAQLVGQGPNVQAPTFTPTGPGQGEGNQVPISGPSTSGNQAPPSDDQMQAAAKQVWPNDDPSKYQYRQGPDGSLQRKPK